MFAIALSVVLPRFTNHIGDLVGSVLASSAVDRGFESRSDQTKDYEIGVCCFSAKQSPLRRKSKSGSESG